MAFPARMNLNRRIPPRVNRKRPGDLRAHLDRLKRLPCVVTGLEGNTDPHHLLGNVDGLPKSMSMKNEDRWAILVCRRIHDEIHHHGDDLAWLAERGIDGKALALSLWEARGDEEAMRRIVERTNAAARLREQRKAQP